MTSTTAGTNGNGQGDKDLGFALAQANALADHLEKSGQFLACEMVKALRRICEIQAFDLGVANEELALFRSCPAPAADLIACTKHRYGAGNVCTKCGAERQRRAKAPKQMSVPGTEPAGAGAAS